MLNNLHYLSSPAGTTCSPRDSDGKLLGTVSWRGVRRAASARLGVRRDGVLPLIDLFRELRHEKARDLMRGPVAVSMKDTLRDVLLKMEEFHENDVAIVDEENCLLGEVNAMRMMEVALRTFRSTEAALEDARSEG